MQEKHGAIRFGNWELRPRDKLNWELFHLRASKRGFGDGTPRWASEDRYYQYDTFDKAILYAADVELKAKCRDEAMTLYEALNEHERSVGRLMTSFLISIAGQR